MAWTFVAVGTSVTGSGTHSTTAPASRAAGDHLILATASRATPRTLSVPSGWDVLYQNDSDNTTLAFLVRIATGDTSDDLSAADLWTGASASKWSQIAAFRGGETDLGQLLVAAASVGTTGTAADIPSAGLAPGADNCLVIACGKKQKTATADGCTFSTDPTGISNRISSAAASANACMAVWSYVIQTTASTLSASSWNQSPDENLAYAASTISLRAATTATAPSISTITNPITDGGAFTITGSFSASGNTLFIGGVSHAIGTENATTITGTMALGVRKYGTTDVIIRNSSGVDSQSAETVINPSASYEYVEVGSLYPTSNRPTATATDISTGDQLRISNPVNTTLANCAIDSGGGIELKPTNTALAASIDVECNDGTGWGTGGTITFDVPTVSSGNPGTRNRRRTRNVRQILNIGRG